MEKPIYKIGFTGTNKGMRPEQRDRVRELFTLIKSQHADELVELHFGLCIGADEQAATIAKEIGGIRVVAHPGLARNPENMLYRSEFPGNDEVREAKKFIERDRDMVDEVSELIAAPLTREERTRSGTWTTVRYARTKSKPILMVLPPLLKPPAPIAPPVRTNAIAGEDPNQPAYMKRGLR